MAWTLEILGSTLRSLGILALTALRYERVVHAVVGGPRAGLGFPLFPRSSTFAILDTDRLTCIDRSRDIALG